MLDKYLGGTTHLAQSAIIGASVAFLLLGSVPNFEMNFIQVHDVGTEIWAESVSMFPDGPCSGPATAWVVVLVAMAVFALVGGYKIWRWGKKSGKLTTRVSWIVVAVGVIIQAFGGGMLLFGFLIAWVGCQ